MTGRAAILVLVLAVLMISYASSMRAYLQQRHELLSLQQEIKTSKASIADLSREKKRWADPAYVRAMAHERLGWVMPGEISYQVIGKNGKPLGQHATLPEGTVSDARPPIWWKTAWHSMELAGNPPKQSDQSQPATRIQLHKNAKR
ncbi:MAG: FtsB family cell division protein [Nocardioidaceae bacterium]